MVFVVSFLAIVRYWWCCLSLSAVGVLVVVGTAGVGGDVLLLIVMFETVVLGVEKEWRDVGFVVRGRMMMLEWS
jgi:hypothetical protein